MPKFFVSTNQIKDSNIYIEKEDVNHIKNVLRAKIDDEIEICDFNTSKNYICKIEKIEDKKIDCKIIKEIKLNNIESKIKVTIFQGLPKADKMELVIQKSVELGVYDITPVKMKRCVVKLDEKDKIKKIERWQKISEVASKQSGRNIIPKINNIQNIDEICKNIKDYDLLLIAYEKEKENFLKAELKKLTNIKDNIKIGVVIGPEGGIDEEEIQKFKENGAKIITLGNRILRTETVALNILSIIMYELED